MRVADLNMTNPAHLCPQGFRTITSPRDCVGDEVVVLGVCQPPFQFMEYDIKKYVEGLLATSIIHQMLLLLTTTTVISPLIAHTLMV